MAVLVVVATVDMLLQSITKCKLMLVKFSVSVGKIRMFCPLFCCGRGVTTSIDSARDKNEKDIDVYLLSSKLCFCLFLSVLPMMMKSGDGEMMI